MERCRKCGRVIYENKLIPGYCLRQNINYVNFKIKRSNRTVVKGCIVDEKNKPVCGAGIEIVKIDKYFNIGNEIYIGIVFTQYDGTYAVSLEINDNYDYKFIVYPPCNE